MLLAVQSTDAGLDALSHVRISAGVVRDRATLGQVAVGAESITGMTWRWKGATVSVIILVLFITAIVASTIGVARAVARDGHGRRPEVGVYDSRRPTL